MVPELTGLLVPLGGVVSEVLRSVDPTPKPEDVKAGWTALVIFLLLGAAVVFLGFSLTKQLRKAQAAQEAGVYDDPAPPRRDVTGTTPATSDTPDASGPAGGTQAG